MTAKSSPNHRTHTRAAKAIEHSRISKGHGTTKKSKRGWFLSRSASTEIPVAPPIEPTESAGDESSSTHDTTFSQVSIQAVSAPAEDTSEVDLSTNGESGGFEIVRTELTKHNNPEEWAKRKSNSGKGGDGDTKQNPTPTEKNVPVKPTTKKALAQSSASKTDKATTNVSSQRPRSGTKKEDVEVAPFAAKNGRVSAQRSQSDPAKKPKTNEVSTQRSRSGPNKGDASPVKARPIAPSDPTHSIKQKAASVDKDKPLNSDSKGPLKTEGGAALSAEVQSKEKKLAKEKADVVNEGADQTLNDKSKKIAVKTKERAIAPVNHQPISPQLNVTNAGQSINTMKDVPASKSAPQPATMSAQRARWEGKSTKSKKMFLSRLWRSRKGQATVSTPEQPSPMTQKAPHQLPSTIPKSTQSQEVPAKIAPRESEASQQASPANGQESKQMSPSEPQSTQPDAHVSALGSSPDSAPAPADVHNSALGSSPDSAAAPTAEATRQVIIHVVDQKKPEVAKKERIVTRDKTDEPLNPEGITVAFETRKENEALPDPPMRCESDAKISLRTVGTQTTSREDESVDSRYDGDKYEVLSDSSVPAGTEKGQVPAQTERSQVPAKIEKKHERKRRVQIANSVDALSASADGSDSLEVTLDDALEDSFDDSRDGTLDQQGSSNLDDSHFTGTFDDTLEDTLDDTFDDTLDDTLGTRTLDETVEGDTFGTSTVDDTFGTRTVDDTLGTRSQTFESTLGGTRDTFDTRERTFDTNDSLGIIGKRRRNRSQRYRERKLPYKNPASVDESHIYRVASDLSEFDDGGGNLMGGCFTCK